MTDSSHVQAPTVSDDLLLAVAEGRHHEPHAVLGQHGFDAAGQGGAHTVIRVRRPLAASVDALLDDGTELSLEHVAHGVGWKTGHRAGHVLENFFDA